MTPLAVMMKKKGFNVSGCDKNLNQNADILKNEGIKIEKGHSIKHVEGIELLVYSRAIDFSCEELKAAENMKIRIISRGEALKEQIGDRELIGVAGTHGKTTTTSMLVHVLTDNGIRVLGMAGGSPIGWESGLVWSKEGWAVCELDESDRTFLLFKPSLGVITSIEADHIGKYYASEQEVWEAFREFALKSKKCLVHVCDKLTENLAKMKIDGLMTVGKKGYCDFLFEEKDGSAFFKGQKINLKMKGKHNLKNAAVVLAVSEMLGLKIEEAVKSLESFQGVKRRMELVIKTKRCEFISDYAHHPTEIKNAIDSLKDEGKKITAVFQPHLFSRTKEFFFEFARSLSEADEIILLPVYPARENPIEGVDSGLIAEALKSMGRSSTMVFSESELLMLLRKLNPTGIITLLGAGDADLMRENIVRVLKENAND